jgi:uncharacterized protein
MKTVFADTFYWIALINPTDDWGDRAIQFAASAQTIKMVTTEEVLVEVLTFYSKRGRNLRQQATILIRGILSHSMVQVVEQSHQSFLDGLDLYERRMDKGYSLMDCISMNTMRKLRINDVLTHDRHFAQEGFVVLFDSMS